MTFPFPTFCPSVVIPPPEITHLTSTGTITNASSYSFPSQTFGAADPTRKIILITLTRNSGSTAVTSGITIGGVTPTELYRRAWISNTNLMTLQIASVPTGTSGTVSIGTATASDWFHIHLFRAVNLTSTSLAASVANVTSDTSKSDSLSAPVGSYAIGAALYSSSTISFSGVMTERAEINFDFYSAVATHGPVTRSPLTVSSSTGTSLYGNFGFAWL